jgi:CDP-glucose 4,6-dehydratase
MESELNSFFKNKRILITGVTGFKGSWLALWLHYMGAKVFGVGFNPNINKNLFYKLKLEKKIKLVHIDVRNFNKLNQFIKKSRPSIIFHMAAQPLILESYKRPALTFEINSFGTLNMLEIIKKNSFVKSAVFVTSDKCYESNFSKKGFKENDKLGGEDPYSGSKSTAEIMVNVYYKSFLASKNIGVASARAGNVIGGGDWSKNRLIPDSIRSFLKKKPIILRYPNFNRPWQHVLEPLCGYLILAKKLYGNPRKYSGPWNFGTERNTLTSVLEVIKRVINLWGSGRVLIKKSKFYEQKNLQLNISKAKKKLKWYPKYSVFEAINITVDWYKAVIIKKKSPLDITLNQIKNYMAFLK